MNPLNMFQSQWWSLLFKWIKNAYFTDLSAAGGMYYTIEPITIAASTDFEIELYELDTLQSDNRPMLGSTSVTEHRRINFNVSDEMLIKFDTDLINFGSVVGIVVPGAFNRIIIKRVGTTVHASINGTPVGNGTSSDTVTFDLIARSVGLNRYFNGIIREVKIWTGGDRTTGTLTRWYPLDERTGTVVRNLAGTLGAEVWDDSPDTVDPAWTDNGDGSWTLVGNGTFQPLLESVGVTANTQYLVSFMVDSISGGTMTVTQQGGGALFTFNSVGSKTALVTPTTGALGFARSSGTINCTISDISIREAPGYGSTVNITDNERDLFMQDPNGDWVNQFWPNLLTYSEQFNNAAWAKSESTVTANAVTAPNGTETADKLVESVNIANHFTQQQVMDLPDNSDIVFSVYAKSAERGWCRLRIQRKDAGGRRAWFNLDSGTIGAVDVANSATIEDVGDGWYRISLTDNSSSGATVPAGQVFTQTMNSETSYDGDGASGIYIWGAQLEEGSTATGYRRTTDVAGQKIEVA